MHQSPLLAAIISATLVGLAPQTTQACERALPWSRLADSASNYGTGVPLVLTASALVAPLVMAGSGADHAFRVLGQRKLGGSPNAEPVSVATPFVLPVALVALDAFALPLGACEIARPTSAMLQAFVVTLGAVTALKWTASRTWPNAGGDPRAPDRLEHPEYATRFNWFDWHRGSAWPSGHTATMMAAASALATYTYHRSWTGYVAYAATLAVATGMWLGDHHWGSDIVSGAMLGFATGYSVGWAFRDETQKNNASTRAIFGPLLVPHAQGVTATLPF